MNKLTNGLVTQKYTQIAHEEEIKFNAPHHFQVYKIEEYPEYPQAIIAEINFQEGSIKENGVNGVTNEDLIAIVIARLEGFQNSDYRSRENACAITKLEEALMWLNKRTLDREARNVEGTNKV